MKKVVAVALLIVCFTSLVPFSCAESVTKESVADFVSKHFANNKMDGIDATVYYDEEDDTFYLFFESLPIAMQAFQAHNGEESSWQTFKSYAYTCLEYMVASAELFGFENPNVTFVYYFTSSDGDITAFYSLALKDGNITVNDVMTNDTEPVIE